ncbi:MAG: ribosome recycling factor [bacterium]|nr:ribosome recycling factor [Candidatus Margulisiibacteriota bacterium]
MQDVLGESEAKMKKAVEVLKKDLAGVRTGRANPALLDHIKVSYYGADVPIKQVASVSVPDARMMVVSPFDKNAAKDIVKAIQTSEIGINPTLDGGVIRLVMPDPSQERRLELVKVIKKESEQGKVALRNVRREAMDSLKKQKNDKAITEDDEKTLDKKVQDLTNKYTKMIDDLVKAKEAEVMEV